MNEHDLKLGLAALEHAREGWQANFTPEMARVLLERVEYLEGLCGRAAKVATVCSRSAQALRVAAADGALKDEHVRGFMVGVAECLEYPEDTFEDIGVEQLIDEVSAKRPS